MTLRRWPDTLPGMMSEGYSLTPVDPTRRTDMEVGARRVRRITQADLDMVQARCRMTPEEYALFHAWFRDNPWSLAGDSDDLTLWSAVGVTVTSAGTGPDGQIASLLTEAATTALHRAHKLLTASPDDRLILCATLKANGRGFARVGLGDPTATTRYANINLSTGAVTDSSGITSATVKDRGNGWYRLTIDATVDAAATGPRFYLNAMAAGTGSTTYAGDGTSGVRACEVMARVYTGKDLFGRTDAEGNLSGAGAGSAWVEVPLATDGQASIEYVETRFDAMPEAAMLSGLNREVSLALEVRNA